MYVKLETPVALPGQLDAVRGATFVVDQAATDWGYTIDQANRKIRLVPYALADGYAWTILVLDNPWSVDQMWCRTW